MVLRDWLTLHPKEVVYIGCDSTFSNKGTKTKANGSGFVYIGYAKDAPNDFDDREIKEIYPRTVDIPGVILIIEGLEVGKYWTWHEKDPSVPKWEPKYEANTDQFEELLMGIVKLTVRDYQRKLMDELKEKKPKTKARMNEVIQRFRKKAMVTDGLEFLKGTSLGEYLIQATEDQVVVRYTHPDLAKLPYEKRYDSMLEKRKELQRERLKQKEKNMYATIKGRSVKHDPG